MTDWPGKTTAEIGTMAGGRVLFSQQKKKKKKDRQRLTSEIS